MGDHTGRFVKTELARTCINIAVVESDPLRVAGFRALLDSEPELKLASLSCAEISAREDIEVALLGQRCGDNVFQTISTLAAMRPGVRTIVTGSRYSDEHIVKLLAAGAKAYVDEAAPPSEFVQAIRVVRQGLIWAPRRVLSVFIDRYSSSYCRGSIREAKLTSREKEVLEMLVEGKSNKEIAFPLGIEERTVKAHIAKLMRKVGVQNRIALSLHAISCSLIPAR